MKYIAIIMVIFSLISCSDDELETTASIDGKWVAKTIQIENEDSYTMANGELDFTFNSFSKTVYVNNNLPENRGTDFVSTGFYNFTYDSTNATLTVEDMVYSIPVFTFTTIEMSKDGILYIDLEKTNE